MNNKGFAQIIVPIIVVAIIAGLVGYFGFYKKSAPIATETNSQAISTSSTKTTANSGWKQIIWHDPYNKILGFRFDAPESWVEEPNPSGSERHIEVASCHPDTCSAKRSSFDVQVIARKYVPESTIPAGYVKSQINVGGILADKVVAPAGIDITSIDFMRGNDWYKIQLFGEKTPEASQFFDHMLSSFTFEAPQLAESPREYNLLKDLDKWSLNYEDKNISALKCSNGSQGDITKSYVFTMISNGYGNPSGDIETPYKKVVSILENDGWQLCNSRTKAEEVDQGGKVDVYTRINRLIGVYTHYSMGVGNSLVVQIQN